MDPLVLIGSLVAVLALAGINWWLARKGKMTRPRVDPLERIDLDLIDFEIGEHARLVPDGVMARSRRGDELAIAILMGDGWIVRRLEPGFIKRVERDGAVVTLGLADFSLPKLALHFEKEEAATIWEARLARLAARAAEEMHHSHGAA